MIRGLTQSGSAWWAAVIQVVCTPTHEAPPRTSRPATTQTSDATARPSSMAANITEPTKPNLLTVSRARSGESTAVPATAPTPTIPNSRPNPFAPKPSCWCTTRGSRPQSAADGSPNRHSRRSSRRVHGECLVNLSPPWIDCTRVSRVEVTSGCRGATPAKQMAHNAKTTALTTKVAGAPNRERPSPPATGPIARARLNVAPSTRAAEATALRSTRRGIWDCQAMARATRPLPIPTTVSRSNHRLSGRAEASNAAQQLASADSAVAEAIIRTGDIRPATAPMGMQSRKNGTLIAAGAAATSVADRPASVRIHWAATTCIQTATALASWSMTSTRKRTKRRASRGEREPPGVVTCAPGPRPRVRPGGRTAGTRAVACRLVWLA